MMDGPWQEVIYNLPLPCLSVGQPSQTEEDRKRQKQKSVQRIDGRGTDVEMVSFIITTSTEAPPRCTSCPSMQDDD